MNVGFWFWGSCTSHTVQKPQKPKKEIRLKYSSVKFPAGPEEESGNALLEQPASGPTLSR
jgi:hypothetical protein